MKRLLYHPLWVHLPALGLLLIILWQVWQLRAVPGEIPLQFNWQGQPNRFGSPLELVIAMPLLSLLYLGISVFFDEVWARQETKKSFNWFSLFDEVTLGFLAGMLSGYLAVLDDPFRGYTFPWPFVLGYIGIAGVMATALELQRPWHPAPTLAVPEDTGDIAAELRARRQAGQHWVYWEAQNPPYISPLIAIFVAAQFVSSVFLWPQNYWVALLQIAIGLSFMLLYGGFRSTVTPDRLYLRLGIIGIPLLRLTRGQIEDVSLHQFHPLRDFGGYGIRLNRQMLAYFLRGNRGVLIRTRKGKQYLIGSDYPERLLTALQVMLQEKGD